MTLGETIKLWMAHNKLGPGALAALVREAGHSGCKYQNIQWLIRHPTAKPKFEYELAKAFNVTLDVMRAWKKGSPIPIAHKAGTRKRPAQLLGADPEAGILLLEHHRAKLGLRPIHLWDSPDDLPDDEYVIVPRLNLRFSAGNGGPIVEADTDLGQGQAFRSNYVRQKRLNPKGLLSARSIGDSMEPRICDGDSLLIDTNQREVMDGQVYAMAWDEELRVKRLYKTPGGGLLIRSDNRDRYPEIQLDASKLHSVSIIGRVVVVSGDV